MLLAVLADLWSCVSLWGLAESAVDLKFKEGMPDISSADLERSDPCPLEDLDSEDPSSINKDDDTGSELARPLESMIDNAV
jgi:hypothetical protein